MASPTQEYNENLQRASLRKRLVVDEKLQPEIRRLMKPNVARFNLNLFMHVACWVAAAVGVFWFDNTIAIIACVVVLSNQIHAFTVLQHECGHRNAYHNDGWNRFVGCALAWFIFMPYTTFKECHRRHHRYLGDVQHDPDEWNYTGGRTRWLPIRVATFVPRFIHISLTKYSAAVRQSVLVELAFNIVSLAVLIGFCIQYNYLNEFILIYAIPLFILAAIINPISRGYEHFPLAKLDEQDKESRMDIAKTTISVTHPFFSWIWANINYHVEHHVYPGVPFYNLPEVSKLMSNRQYLRHRFLLQDIFSREKKPAVDQASDEKEDVTMQEASNV